MRFYDADFETNITVVTAQEYVEEIEPGAPGEAYDKQFAKELMLDTWGQEYDYFVRAEVSAGTYYWRLFAPVRGDYKNSIKNAIAEVMNELLDEYYAHKYEEFMQEQNKK